MGIALHILVIIIALLHLYFLYFEMFAWETTGKKVFKNFPPELFPQTKSMAANQGLYNGFLAAGLVWSLLIKDPVWHDKIALFFLGCVAVAGIYGALSVSKRILYIQALPALVAIALILIK